MKKTLGLAAIILAVVCIFSLVGCGSKVDADDIWKDAKYTKDTELGKGEKTFVSEVTVGEHTVKFTVHTDSKTVGDAMIENELVSGEKGDYGLYIKVVNGITADYDVDKSYWTFNINGEYAMTGADATEIIDGAVYQFVYTK